MHCVISQLITLVTQTILNMCYNTTVTMQGVVTPIGPVLSSVTAVKMAKTEMKK